MFRRSRRSVAVGKHLCGLATDLTLRCYVNAVAATLGSGADQSGGGGGVPAPPAQIN
eukprot:COSAG01_NODE_49871_length_368_cov_1.059480_2_plen_56_part_01